MPGEFQPTLNRYKKGAARARREALGLPDPQPTTRRKRKIPKHRRQQLSDEKGHVCYGRQFLPMTVANISRFVKHSPVTPITIDAIDQ